MVLTTCATACWLASGAARTGAQRARPAASARELFIRSARLVHGRHRLQASGEEGGDEGDGGGAAGDEEDGPQEHAWLHCETHLLAHQEQLHRTWCVKVRSVDACAGQQTERRAEDG